MILSISIPDTANCLLRPGQEVDHDTLFLEKKIASEECIIVAKRLHIPSDKIFKYLKKFVGDTVNKGEVLAEKKSLIGTSSIVSDYAGVIKEINHNDGSVIISTLTPQSKQIKAYFKGEVVEVEKNHLMLKVEKVQEFALKQATADFGGETFYLKDASKPISDPQTSNKIMVSESITSYLKTKAEALDIKGFVTLKKLSQDSNLPYAQIKNIEDFKKVLHLNFPYCLIDKQYSKIYFYK